MALVTANTATVEKRKNIKLAFSGWALPTGSNATSPYGTGILDCADVEFTTIGRPDPDENEVIELPTSHRTIKASVAKKSWQNWSKIGILNDEAGTNWKEFVAAKELETTGTLILSNRLTGTVIGAWTVQVVGMDSGDGGADELDDAFTPTFAILADVTPSNDKDQ